LQSSLRTLPHHVLFRATAAFIISTKPTGTANHDFGSQIFDPTSPSGLPLDAKISGFSPLSKRFSPVRMPEVGGIKLYPITRPLAALAPPPVIVAEAANPASTSGALTFRLPDNTRVEGSFVTGNGTNSGTGTAIDTNGNICKILF
jgi:hypothetical protein